MLSCHFWTWCWRRLLRVPWTARRPKQSILKEINPEYSLGGLTLKLSYNNLATWWEEPTHWKRPWCWERSKAGGEEGNRGWDGWMASPTQWTWVWANSGRRWRTGKPGMLQTMGLQRFRCDWATEKQQLHLIYVPINVCLKHQDGCCASSWKLLCIVRAGHFPIDLVPRLVPFPYFSSCVYNNSKH